jgi:hypothetical protein
MSRRIVSSMLVLVLLLQGVAPMSAHAEPAAAQQHCECCSDDLSADLDCADICGAVAVVSAAAPCIAAERPTQQAIAIPAGDPGPAYLPLNPPPIS